MPAFDSLIVLTGGTLAALMLIGGVWTWSWRAWLQLKRLELGGGTAPGGAPSAANRIELADLRERVKKLEAIAAGVDL